MKPTRCGLLHMSFNPLPLSALLHCTLLKIRWTTQLVSRLTTAQLPGVLTQCARGTKLLDVETAAGVPAWFDDTCPLLYDRCCGKQMY